MRVLVVGSAVSGRAAARLLRQLGHEVSVYDERPGPLAELRADGFEVHNGSWTRRRLHNVDLVVTSPGVPPHATPLRDAAGAGVEIWSEVELGARHVGPVPLVGVTGTNGKTTVTRVVAEMLQASGLDAPATGNIGDPLTRLALAHVTEGVTWDALSVELSSFQLHFTHRLRPAVAVILNVAPDHLDWHGGYDAYLADKRRLLQCQEPDDVAIYDADDDGATRAVAGTLANRIPVSGRRRPERGLGPENGKIWLGDGIAVDRADLPDLDQAYLANLVAAAGAALAVGATPDGVIETMRRFETGAHRRQVVAAAGGVTWVDDSKATNPHAATAAAAAYDSVVLIAGGRNKGLDLAPVLQVPSVRRVVAIGEAAPELLRLGGARVETAVSMDEAVARAAELARPGDTVLLSPACASFDMFDSYAHRGEAFATAVAALMGEGS